MLEQHIYLSGEKISCILHTRKINHFLNAKIGFASSMKMLIQPSSRPTLKKYQHSLLPQRPYCSVPVTVTELKISYIILVLTQKIALSPKNNNDLHTLQTLHRTEGLLKYDVSFRKILITQRANTNLPCACMKVLQSNKMQSKDLHSQHSFLGIQICLCLMKSRTLQK